MDEKRKHDEGGFIFEENDIGTDQGRELPEDGKILDNFDTIDFGLPPSYRGKQKYEPDA